MEALRMKALRMKALLIEALHEAAVAAVVAVAEWQWLVVLFVVACASLLIAK